MSLVNDVLRDLEKRQAPERSGLQGAGSASIVEAQNSAHKGLIALVIVLLAVIFVMAGMFMFSEEQTGQEALMSSADVLASDSGEPAAEGPGRVLM